MDSSEFTYENTNSINFLGKEALRQLDPRRILSICMNICEKHKIELTSQMKDFFKHDTDKYKKNKEVYAHLLSFNAKYVMTTNYDEYLEKAKSSNIEEVDSNLAVESLTPGSIKHIHGSICEPKGMVISLADYIKQYDEESNAPALLKEVFEHTVLFVGYELAELEILEFLIRKAKVPANVVSHYILRPFFLYERNLVELHNDYYKQLGVRMIPYFIDDIGYDSLADVIKNWAKIFTSVIEAKETEDFMEGVSLIDEVVK